MVVVLVAMATVVAPILVVVVVTLRQKSSYSQNSDNKVGKKYIYTCTKYNA